jgi:hypothetical protein
VSSEDWRKVPSSLWLSRTAKSKPDFRDTSWKLGDSVSRFIVTGSDRFHPIYLEGANCVRRKLKELTDKRSPSRSSRGGLFVFYWLLFSSVVGKLSCGFSKRRSRLVTRDCSRNSAYSDQPCASEALVTLSDITVPELVSFYRLELADNGVLGKALVDLLLSACDEM